MACLYTHKGKTYTKEELIEYLKNNQKQYGVEPDFSNIEEILATIPSNQKIYVQSGKMPMQVSNLESLAVGEKRATIRTSAYKDGIYEFDGKKYKVTSRKSDEQGNPQKVNISDFKSVRFLKNIFKKDYKEGLFKHIDEFFEGKKDLYVYMIERINDDVKMEYLGSTETFEEPTTTTKTLDNRVLKRLKALLAEENKKLTARILTFESAKERKGYLPKEETVNKLKDLKEELSTLEDIQAFFKVADFMNNELAVTEDFLENKFDMTNPDHINFLLQIRTQLNSYKDLNSFLPSIADYNSDIRKTASDINFMYNNVSETVEQILEEYMINFVKTNTKRDVTKEEILELLKESKDINFIEAKMGGMANSMDPLLQLLQRHVEKTREQVYENTNGWIDKIRLQGQKLKQAGVEGFDWMFQKAKDGKLTGRILQRISELYYKERRDVLNILKDEFGNKREYIYKPGEKLSDAEKQHNIKLGEDKKKVSSFFQAEDTKSGVPIDGENHKYTDEFKRERSFFEYYVVNEQGFSEWTKKPFIPGTRINNEVVNEDQYDRFYKMYKRKYYNTRESYKLVSKKVNGVKIYTGEVEKVNTTHVKPEFVEVITEKGGVRTKFGSEDYHKLMNDNSVQGKARKEFFEFYKNTSNTLLDKLPLNVKDKMKGKMFRIRSTITKDIKSIGVFNAVKKSIRQFINPDVIFTSRELDEDGNYIEDVPIFFTGDLKSDSKLKGLNKKLEELRAELTKDPSNSKLIDKIKIVKNSILIEENKLTPEELETDMLKSLTKAAQMAENYDLMKGAESTLLIAERVIQNKRFFKLNAAGQKDYIKDSSQVEQRMRAYMRMIFYSNSPANQTKTAKLLQNFNSFVAYKSLGLNPFSAINNTIMANINNRIQGFGKQFGFNNSHLNQAIKDTLGYISTLDFAKNLGKDEYLKNPTNKFEAMLKKFNWIDNNQIIDDSSVISKLMFGGITGGEFIAQSNTAIAKLRSTMLTNSKTNERLSLWEAHEFVNGELKLKDGFEYSPEQRRVMSVDIKNMNKMIHGNYSENDKVALQEHALGQTVMQFKKWMYNFGKSRFGNTYFDETLGDYAEGRYKTAARLISILKAGAMFDYNTIKATIQSLPDYQKSNLKMLQVEIIYWTTTAALAFLLEGLAEGIDDDDEELKMVVNFLRKQSDRVGGELDAMINPKSIYANLKNPVSGLRAASDFGDILVEIFKTPINYLIDNDEGLYIQKGTNKGRLRLSKEVQDVIPVANLRAQFENLLISGNFYFK